MEAGLTGERYTPELWQKHYTPVADWDETFRNRQWDALGDMSQTVRHAVVAGYVHKLLKAGRALDAGCGEGVLIDYLDPARIDYTGFDISATAIQRAKERYPKARLFSCAIEDLALPASAAYDVVIFNDSLSTLADPIGTIDRYWKFVNAGGFMIVSQYQPPDPAHNGALLTRMLEVELAAGRYPVDVRSEVFNCDTARKWRSYCLRRG